ncbi:MAG: alpha/beta fold hydrolase [Anaerolineae bacterium]|nr:alpha/beta fold hydrolase [Anaerolineae bacterium]
MTQHPWLDPKPFYFRGGPVGCLLIHGFTGSPPEMRPLGEYLARQGLTVSGPLLAGHGTDYHDLAKTTWRDWYASAEEALVRLQAECVRVFVGGLSLGSLLTLRLAALHPDIAGVVLYSPALIASDWRMKFVRPFRYIMRWNRKEEPQDADLTDPEAHKMLWSYDVIPGESAYQVSLIQKEARRLLPSITTPVLIFQSSRDALIRHHCGQIVHDEIGSADKTLIVLHNSGHCLTVDSEREFVWQKTHEWVAARSGAPATAQGHTP